MGPQVRFVFPGGTSLHFDQLLQRTPITEDPLPDHHGIGVYGSPDSMPWYTTRYSWCYCQVGVCP